MSEKRKIYPAGTIAGRYQATGRGFGFLIPEAGTKREDDYFIPPRSEGGAWHGDTVLALPARGEAGPEERRTAAVTAVLERANKTVTGTIRKHSREIWLEPDSDKLPGAIQIVGKVRGARAGDKAAIAVTSYGSTKHPPMGILREVFGRAGTRESSTAAILYNYEIEREFPAPVLAAAAEISQQVDAASLQGRTDLRDKLIITIDGASAKDLDDAVSLEKDEKGRWILGVHIADVSHYVAPGTPLDLEAFERGTSVYFADQVVPMLPVSLSNGICSLNPQVDRLTLSCIMVLAADGAVLDHRIEKSVIRTAERMTYEDCNILLGETQDDILEERYAHVTPMLREMAALAGKLAKRRRLRGSLDLETGESSIVCDENGAPVEIVRREQGISEALIESFMLAANECVAEHLFQLHKPAVYRVHEKPSADKTESLRAMLAPLGLDLKEADSFHLQQVLDAVKGKPEAAMVSSMVLRSLMKARYDAENLGHFGLAAKFYCHFTSPIRRYPDLMIHRILTALLEGKLEGAKEKKLAAAARRTAVQASEREIAAQNAEREIEKLYMAEYMAGHIGETFPAAVSGVTKYGLFVALESGVEGFLSAAALPQDRYHYDELRMTLTGEHGHAYAFGMALEVLCAAADPASGQVEFSLPGVENRREPSRRLNTQSEERPRHRKGGSRRAVHTPKGRKGKKR